MSQFKTAMLLLPLLLAAAAPNAAATVLATDWTSVTTTTATGTLNGIAVNVTNLVGDGGPVIGFSDMSTADYAPYPLGASQESVDYSFSDNWSASFGAAIPNLMLYCKFWRGPNNGDQDPPFFTYQFDQPFTILTGLGACTVNGNWLWVPSTIFQDGILLFAGPVSSVGVVANNANSESRQVMTFGVEDDIVATESSTWSSLKRLYR